MLINAGIKKIVVRKMYPDKLGQELLSEAGIEVEVVKRLSPPRTQRARRTT
jgi:deoxycytidylate deaminase